MLAGILSISADGIITVDASQRIMDFNHGAEQIFGYTAAEVIGQPLDLLLPRRHREAHESHVRAFGAGRETARRMGHRREIFGRRKDGEEFPAEASICRLELPDGNIVYSAVLRDVTERKRAEQEQRFLSEAGAALARTLEHEPTLELIPQLTVPFMADWATLDVPESDREIRHYVSTHADAARQPAVAALSHRFPVDHDSPWFSVDVLRHGRPTLVTPMSDDWLEAHVHGDGHAALLRTVGIHSLLGVPLVIRQEIVGALTLARAAERRPFDEGDLLLATTFAERAASTIDNARLYRTAQRASRARDVVLGVVSHDLRNPITAIERCARFLRDGAADTVDHARMVRTIAEAAGWSQRLIRDLLDVAAIEAGQLSLVREAVDLGLLLEGVRETFERRATEQQIPLTVVPPIASLPIHVDPERILQVLANLVDNALKFTSPGGRVEVRARGGAREVEVVVTDTGPGIPPDEVPHLFDLYWHARRAGRAEGSGYGLSIARGIVEAHGGRIWVESVPGEGATFRFTLPVGSGFETVRERSSRA